jgi:hypothetical protein
VDVIGILVLVGAAGACSLAGPQAFVVDPGEGRAPARPEVVEVVVKRGVGPRPDGCGEVATSCDDLGWIGVTVADVGPDVGFVVRRASGELPADPFEEPQAGTVVDGGRWLDVVAWIDGATDDQEPVEAEVEVVAVSRAGVESEPVLVPLVDPGAAAGSSCTASGRPVGMLAMGVALVARRRRAQRLAA